jgi:hypothetical protein
MENQQSDSYKKREERIIFQKKIVTAATALIPLSSLIVGVGVWNCSCLPLMEGVSTTICWALFGYVLRNLKKHPNFIPLMFGGSLVMLAYSTVLCYMMYASSNPWPCAQLIKESSGLMFLMYRLLRIGLVGVLSLAILVPSLWALFTVLKVVGKGLYNICYAIYIFLYFCVHGDK